MCRLPHLLVLLLIVTVALVPGCPGSMVAGYDLSKLSQNNYIPEPNNQLMARYLQMRQPSLDELLTSTRLLSAVTPKDNHDRILQDMDDASLQVLATQLGAALDETRRQQERYRTGVRDFVAPMTTVQDTASLYAAMQASEDASERESRAARDQAAIKGPDANTREPDCRDGRSDWHQCSDKPTDIAPANQQVEINQQMSNEKDEGEDDERNKNTLRKKREISSGDDEDDKDTNGNSDGPSITKRAGDFHNWGGKRMKSLTSVDTRIIPWDGKRMPAFNSWGGKRAPAFHSWGGKRAPEFNSWGGKRAPEFNSWGGKRASEFNSWGGKRAPEFNSWGGKRAPEFNSWGGKRAPEFNSWGGKRAPEFNSWGGKRASEFNSWGGKRAPEFNSWGGKRAPEFNSWGGKRAPAFNSWGGKRAPEFNSWGGKRAPEFNSWGGKRSLDIIQEGIENKNDDGLETADYNSESLSHNVELGGLPWNHVIGKREPMNGERTVSKPPNLRSVKNRIVEFYPWGGKRSNGVLRNESKE